MTPKQLVKAYKKHGSLKAIARNEGLTWHRTRKLYKQAVLDGLMEDVNTKTKEKKEPIFTGELKATGIRKFDIPKKGVFRYLFTSAQNSTKIHEKLWQNLLILGDYYNAGIYVSRFTYMKSGLGEKGDKAHFTTVKKESLHKKDTLAWAPELEKYINDERIEVAPGLVWCGDWQRLPTTERPLRGFETYTGRNSGIFPHAKLEMQSIPSSKFEDTKFNYTTGTVTMRNYIKKGAGLKAEFHHCYGAMLVEVDTKGNWWCRQLNADSEGTIYDLDIRVKGGKLTTGHRVEAITFGDIHVQEMDYVCDELSKDMMNVLKPKYVFYHDVLNFGGRNHHNIDDPFKKYESWLNNKEDVRNELHETLTFLFAKVKKWKDTQHIVVDSNHDRAMERWLREADWKNDPINALFYVESVYAKLSALEKGEDKFHLINYWWNNKFNLKRDIENIRFLNEDESFPLCVDANGGIECGMHGHLGPNGRPGSAAAFAKLGRKANVAHTHQAGIYDGIFTAGTSSLLDMIWNRGPSSWSHTHTVTYENGKRAQYTMFAGKWRAHMNRISGDKDALY